MLLVPRYQRLRPSVDGKIQNHVVIRIGRQRPSLPHHFHRFGKGLHGFNQFQSLALAQIRGPTCSGRRVTSRYSEPILRSIKGTSSPSNIFRSTSPAVPPDSRHKRCRIEHNSHKKMIPPMMPRIRHELDKKPEGRFLSSLRHDPTRCSGAAEDRIPLSGRLRLNGDDRKVVCVRVGTVIRNESRRVFREQKIVVGTDLPHEIADVVWLPICEFSWVRQREPRPQHRRLVGLVASRHPQPPMRNPAAAHPRPPSSAPSAAHC